MSKPKANAEESEPSAPIPNQQPKPVVPPNESPFPVEIPKAAEPASSVADMVAAAVTAALAANGSGPRPQRVSIADAIGPLRARKAERTKELDEDPDLFWNGQNYQVTPEARLREVREIKASRKASTDPVELARRAAEQAAKALEMN